MTMLILQKSSLIFVSIVSSALGCRCEMMFAGINWIMETLHLDLYNTKDAEISLFEFGASVILAFYFRNVFKSY